MSNTNKILTPECEGKWMHIFKPNCRFKQDGEYSVTCVIDENSAAEVTAWNTLIKTLTDELDAFYNAQNSMAKSMNRKATALKRCQYFPWKQEANGQRIFVAKNNAFGTKKDGTRFETKPKIIGPDLEPLTEDQLDGQLGNGTRLRVGFTANYWVNDAQGVGVSARLVLVQIITPKYYSPGDDFYTPEGPDGHGSGLVAYPRDVSLFKSTKDVGVSVNLDSMKGKSEIVDGGFVDLHELFENAKQTAF